MKIGIIVAMQKELHLIAPLLEDRSEKDIEGYRIITGRLEGHDIALMQCGIGKVNSALSTMMLIKTESPDLVINSGVAGGADKSMHVLDMFIATGVAYHDVWCGPGTVYGAAHGMEQILEPSQPLIIAAKEMLDGSKTKFGLICSGDKFITEASEIREIKSHFPDALAVDMESASIAQVCVMQGVPFNIIRVISDTPGEAENISQYENFWTVAPRETFASLRKLLTRL